MTILQDLQGPKIRVGNLPAGSISLTPHAMVSLVPEADFFGDEAAIRVSCPRCGARHTVTREGLEAYVAKK